MPSLYFRQNRHGRTLYLRLRDPWGNWRALRAPEHLQELATRSERAARVAALAAAENLESDWLAAEHAQDPNARQRLTAAGIPLESTPATPRAPREHRQNTVETLLQDFELQAFPELKPRTRAEYIKSLRTWRRWLETIHPASAWKLPDAIAPERLLQYRAHRAAELEKKKQPTPARGRRPARPARALHGARALLADAQALRALERYALARGILDRETVLQTLRRPKLPRRVRRLPDEQQTAALLRAAAEYTPQRNRGRLPHALALRLIIETGIRHAELLALRWMDLELEPHRRRLVVRANPAIGFSPKSHEERAIPLSASLSHALEEYRNTLPAPFRRPDAPFVSSSNRRPTHARQFPRSALQAIFTAAGIPPDGLHVLRVLACVRWMRAGVPPEECRRLMGHSKLSTTLEIYARHVRGEDWFQEVRDRLEAIPALETPGGNVTRPRVTQEPTDVEH